MLGLLAQRRRQDARPAFGFEYLIAPDTIAHLKLSEYLLNQKHKLKDDERLQVFLTNTLEPIGPFQNLLLPAVTAEVEAAQAVKKRRAVVTSVKVV